MSKNTRAILIIFLSVALFGMLALMYGCNPVKKVLQDTSKMKQVFDKGVELGWCVNDSVYVSDTTILLDTLHVIESTTDTLKVDSVVYITKTDYKTITKTVTIRDTTVVTDNSRINLLQKELQNKGNEILLFQEKLTNSVNKITLIKKERNKWRLYFFILLTIFGAFLFRKPLKFLINRVSPIKL